MSFPTWSDLNSPSLIPPLGARNAPDVGSLAVMVSTKPDMIYIKKCLDQPCSSAFFMGELISAEAGGNTVPGTFFAGPYIGAPYAVMLLESLISRGARQIIVMGWCGAISPALQTGDIFIPSGAICQEGTTPNYMASETAFPMVPVPVPRGLAETPGLSARVGAFFQEKNLPYKTGPVWTTDAIYRETAEKVAFFRSRGALAVEMECSALFSVAAHRQVELVTVLVVSDDVTGNRWKPAFSCKMFAAVRRQVADAIIEFSPGNE